MRVFSFFRNVYEKMYIGIILHYLKGKGLSIANGYKFIGIPIIKLFPHSKIIIGKNFRANSHKNSNIAGIMMPSIIATSGNDAVISIGDNVQISGVSIVAAKSIEIGNNVMLGTGACIWDNDFHPTNAEERLANPNSNVRSKSIVIGDNVFIGARVIILKGVKIGENSIVSAGSVVFSDVESNSLFAGNPAKFIKKIN